VEPMFGLHLYTPPPLKERERDSDDPTNVLLIGPPGSGKSSRLKSHPNVWVFDLRLARKRSTVIAGVQVGAGPLTPPVTPPDTWDSAFDASALPTSLRTIIGVDHFEHRLGEADFRDHLLRFLEDAIHRDRRTVWIASDREPLEVLEEMGPKDKNPVELDRWRRLFQSFQKEIVGFTDEASPLQEHRVKYLQARSVPAVRAAISKILDRERALTPPLLAILEDVSSRFPSPDAVTDEDLGREMRNAAEPYYRVLWSGCSTAEKLALRQLADEGVINPTNRSVVQRLIQAGLVLRDPACRIMNKSFEEFVTTAEPTSQIATWEREGVVLPWASIKTTLLTIALSLGGLLILTQQQLVGAWIGLIPTLAPVAPSVLKMMSSTQRSSKPDGVPV